MSTECWPLWMVTKVGVFGETPGRGGRFLRAFAASLHSPLAVPRPFRVYVRVRGRVTGKANVPTRAVVCRPSQPRRTPL